MGRFADAIPRKQCIGQEQELNPLLILLGKVKIYLYIIVLTVGITI